MSPLSARIRLLPETVVNRIAAGEVIERPAAAVKELVENALDAGATPHRGRPGRRRHRAHRGHRRRLRHDADELALAVQRHATSKLADDDLVRIATLGFRGEALPSIGAAARLADRLPAHQARPHANAIRVEGGRVARSRPRAGAAGHPRRGARPVLRHPGAAQIPQAPAHRGRPGRGACCAGSRWPRRAWRSGWRSTERGVRPAGAGSRRAGRRAARARRRRGDAPAGGERGALRLAGFAGVAGGDPRHRRGAGADGERPPGRRPGAADGGARRLSRRDRRRALSGRWRCGSTCRPRRWT